MNWVHMLGIVDAMHHIWKFFWDEDDQALNCFMASFLPNISLISKELHQLLFQSFTMSQRIQCEKVNMEVET